MAQDAPKQENQGAKKMGDTDALNTGFRMDDVDLFVNPRYAIIYRDIPDTIFVYERQCDRSLELYGKYIYDENEKEWVSIDVVRPRVKISKHRRKDAQIVGLKPIRRNAKR